MTITFGTQKQVDAAGDRVNIVSLTSTTAIGFYSSAADGLQARHLTLAAGVITLGANELTIDGASGITNHVRSTMLTSTSVLLVYAYSGTTHRARVITVTGTTLSAGAIKNLTDTLSVTTFNSVDALSSSKGIYCYKDNSNNGIARVLSVSGTTVSGEGSAFQFDATGAFNVSVAALSSTKAVVCWIDNNNSQRPTGEVLNISGTTVTGNADVQLSTTAGITTIVHNLMVRAIDSSKLFISWTQDATSKIYGLVLTESANTLTFGALWTSSITAPGAFREVAVSINSTSKITVSCTHTASNELPIFELSISGTTITEEDETEISGIVGINDQWIVPLTSITSIVIWDGTTEAISAVVSGGTLTLSIIPKPASIDASGTFIYLALLQDGTPILSKFSTALDADGETVFDPGAGDTIGVECGRFDANVIWIAGLFDGTNQVEKSEDAGSTFVVKDSGFNPGGVFAFDVGPDVDTKVIVNNNDTQTLETTDNGATWTVITTENIEALSIDRLAKNTQETVFGNFGDVNNSINYSINSGADIEDFQTGVFPNENVTGVIAN
jgi:hypothetical protein